MERRPTLSLNEWAVLGVLAERPRHGYDIAAELRPNTAIGGTWRVTRPLVYRALDRLEDLGLAEARRTEPGDAAPPRTVYAATRRGRAALRKWLDTPVAHLRDVRSALLLKLVLLEVQGRDAGGLVRAQRTAFDDLLGGHRSAPPSGDVAALWRHHSAAAVAAFLEDLNPTRSPVESPRRARPNHRRT